MLVAVYCLQTKEALAKAREKLEYIKDTVLIPRSLAGGRGRSCQLKLFSHVCVHMYVSALRTRQLLYICMYICTLSLLIKIKHLCL